jgi:hypothetical protein
MGGPHAGVLLPAALSTSQHNALERLLISLGIHSDDGIHLQIVTTVPIGGSFHHGQGRPFAVETSEPAIETHEPHRLLHTFGFLPQQEIRLDALANQPEDHHILGLLAVTLAEQYSGVVDFGGALFPSLPSHVYENGWFWQARWEQVADYSRALINSLPGIAIELPYNTGTERSWVYHVADTTFLRAWLAHPEFHMIK